MIGKVADSLDHYIRDAIHDYDLDTANPSAATTVISGSTHGASNPGALPGHQVDGFIARGGMGAIYRARQVALEREVAVKVMTRMAESPEMAARFRWEALVLGRLAHPNIVPVYDIGTDDEGQLFYTMKLVKGHTLQAILNDLQNGDAEALRQHSLTSLLTVFRKVCDAMAFAHSQGVLHRDLKPNNIMVGEFGEVLVMDWGLAKRLNDEFRIPNDEFPESSSFVIRNSSFTAPPQDSVAPTLNGAVMGTPQYMSPEQAMGQIDELDGRSDIFSLGGILYAILTLRPPVEGSTLEEVLEKVRTGSITSPTDMQSGTRSHGTKGAVLEAKLIKPLPHAPGGRVPAALSSVVMKALRADKARRYQTVGEFSADIEAYQGGFATGAEQAGAVKQLKLLMLRHKAVTAALAVLLLVSVGFVLKVVASERKATRNAEIATANEQRANVNAEQTRRALKDSQLAVAEAGFRNLDPAAMARALESVPEDLRDQRWDYLSAKQDASLGALRLPGFAEVRAVKALPDKAGQFVIADGSGAVGIVDVRSGAVLRTITTNLTGKPVLAISEDGLRLAVTAQGAAEVKLYQIADGRLEKTVPAPSSGVITLTFAGDGRQLAVSDDMGTNPDECSLFLLNLADGAVLWKFRGHYQCVISSPEGGRLFLATSARRYFIVLDVVKGTVISQMTEFVIGMSMSRDKSRLALALFDGTVIIVDVATGLEKRRTRLHQGSILEVLWTANDHLLTIGNDFGFETGRHVMRSWETATFSPRGTFFGLQPFQMLPAFALQPLSGDLVVSGNPPQRWRLPMGLEAARFTSRTEQGWSTCFLSDTVLISRGDYVLSRYDVTNPRSPTALQPSLPNSFMMAKPYWPGNLVALGKRINGAPFSIKLYSTADARFMELREFPMLSWTMSMDFDPGGKRLLATSRDQGSFMFDVASGETLLNLRQKMERAVFVGNGERFAAIVNKKRLPTEVEDELTLFDAGSGKALRSTLYRLRLNELAASPDRKFIAIAGSEQVIRVLDAETLEERVNFRAHDAEITALTFHPHLPILASGSADGSVKLWEYQTAKLRQTFLGFDGIPIMIAYSPNGRLLSVEGQEHTARLFDLSDQIPPATVVPAVPAPTSVPNTKDGGKWQDMIAALTEEQIVNEGNGWRREGGKLRSSVRDNAELPLPGDLRGASYEVRIALRHLKQKEALLFHIALPVGDRMAGLDVDAQSGGFYTGLVRVDGQLGKTLPGAVHGRQFKDSEWHGLEVAVRLHGVEATITAKLDDRPLYRWSGAVASLSTLPFWNGPPGRLALCTRRDDWEVGQVRVRRMGNDE